MRPKGRPPTSMHCPFAYRIHARMRNTHARMNARTHARAHTQESGPSVQERKQATGVKDVARALWLVLADRLSDALSNI